MLEERRSEVLRTLVEEYIRTGEAVSSRTVVARSELGVSTATVRGDLAILEGDGFVFQPHTSSGRVPTGRAYRYYVDHLVPSKARSATQAKIVGFFDSVQLELSKLLKATSQLLAEVTQLPAVVVAPGVTGERIRAVHLVQLSADHALAVVVTEGGRAIQERVRLDGPTSPGEVEEAQRLLSETVVGLEVGGTIAVGEEALAGAGRSAAGIVSVVVEVLSRAASAGSDVFVGGTGQMAAVWEDISAVRRVLDVLEREAMVLNILARAPGTSIQIGAELPGSSDVDMAVVSKTYESGAASGSLGVFGPMRMNYRRVISAVEEVSRELEDRIQ